jgi:Raf kinase inhibitor-like YbhB/YbcL family protein
MRKFILSLLAVMPIYAQPFTLRSPAFTEGQQLPDNSVLNALDCRGENVSPALEWSNAPAATKSFALVLDDYEARGGDGFVHWAIYNIPARTTSLPANAGASGVDLASGGRHAYSDFLQRSYGGPCPPEGTPHKYRFTVFALDMPPIDDAGTPMTWRKLRFIIRDHILGQASLTGLRGYSGVKARVARVWHGQVPASRGDEYEKYLYENGVVKLRETPGNLGAQMFRRKAGDRADFVVISYWPSEDAIRAWAGENLTKARLLPRDPEFLIDPESEVKHYVIAAEEMP